MNTNHLLKFVYVQWCGINNKKCDEQINDNKSKAICNENYLLQGNILYTHIIYTRNIYTYNIVLL